MNLLIIVLSITATQANKSAFQNFINANNLFASAVYKNLKEVGEENFLLSPYSAESVLALIQIGSNGDTAKELRTALHLPEGKDQIEAGVKASLSLLRSNKLIHFYSANKLYIANKFHVSNDFHNVGDDIFGTYIGLVNFTQNIVAANIMNKWVKDRTNNKINNLIDPEILSEETLAVLINALYFQSNWVIPFNKNFTRNQLFYKSSENVIETNMMHQRQEEYNYYESSELNAKFLELPFKGGEVSLVIVLPYEMEGLSAVENQIEKVLATHDFNRTFVNIALPKFNIDTTIDLQEVLESLNVEKMFDIAEADLSGITGKPGDIVINEIVQKTFIDVEEYGIGATAATSTNILGEISARMYFDSPKEFIADHPFMFYIKAKDLIMFVGRVTSPSK